MIQLLLFGFANNPWVSEMMMSLWSRPLPTRRQWVWGPVEIARGFGGSDLIIGLTIVAIGISLPELASSLLAIRKGTPETSSWAMYRPQPALLASAPDILLVVLFAADHHTSV